MATAKQILRGIIQGKTIELAEDPRLPDGQRVTVELTAEAVVHNRDRLERACGSWQDMPEFDDWLSETYQARLTDRRSAAESGGGS